MKCVIDFEKAKETVKCVVKNKELKKILYSSFDEISLTTKEKNVEIEKIASKAFENVDFIKSVELPPNLKEIEKKAFYNCYNLKNLVLNDDSKTEGELRIQSYSFENCSNLETVYLKTQKKVSIEGCAFKNCFNLRCVVLECKECNLESDSFENTDILTLYASKNKIKEIKKVFRKTDINVEELDI